MLDEAFLYSEAIDLTTYGARSDQKTVLTPNRNARDVRNADPLPLFLSQGATRATQRAASNSVTDPDTYRLRWDAKFGVTASLRNGPQLKINAIGEVFVPLTGSGDPSLAPEETS
jgi:hypothetical protein